MDSQALHGALRRLASNHQWTWAPSCEELLTMLPGSDRRAHPAEVVSNLAPEQLDALLDDTEFMSWLGDEIAGLDSLGGLVDPVIAYCSPEFGLTAYLPQYAGGLGVLSGDHLKAASDLSLPLAGVGLFYRNGVFQQMIDHGEQVEIYGDHAPLEAGAVDTGVIVEVPFPERVVQAKVWQIDVGRIPLLLLDTNLEANSERDRNITDRLYVQLGEHRIDQEMILGVGGARATAALGWDIQVHHLNEGHAGFIILELIDRVIEGGDLRNAVDLVRRGVVFTTHTPVPAGIDRFERGTLIPYLGLWAERWGIAVDDLWRLGEDPSNDHQFNMAAWCLRQAGAANGVSHMHGEVSRDLFSDIGHQGVIGSVTNGVHARTWTEPSLQRLFDETLGRGWAIGDPSSWEGVANIDDEQIARARRHSSHQLADFVLRSTGQVVDPDALIIGFARRFAPYKRATLILHQKERLAQLLGDDQRPVHFLFAGKAHPSDDLGRSLVSEIIQFSNTPESNNRFMFLPDYDMEVGMHLVRGSDVWLNNPVRPREASGTSGEKAVLNGGLNCSILDGWWAEMFDGSNGWAIPTSASVDPHVRDFEESDALLDLLFAIRDEYHRALPVWSGRIRHAWRTLGPKVTAARMVGEYRDRIYGPALERAF